MAEALLEATPQYCLQLSIILNQAVYPTWLQWFSLITSLISLNIPIIQKYFQQHICEPVQWENGNRNVIFKKIAKNCVPQIMTLFFNTCGKILCFSLLFAMLPFTYIAFLYFGPMVLLMTIQIDLFDLRKEKDCYQQRLEGIILGLLNQSNLTNIRSAKMHRMVVFYASFLFYVVYVSTLMGQGNAHKLGDCYTPEDIMIINIVGGVGLGCLFIS